MSKPKNKRANALILSVSTLFILSAMAVGFSQLMVVENRAVVNYCDAFTADLLAQAGINYAVQRLRDDFDADPTKVTRDWMYRTLDQPYIDAPVLSSASSGTPLPIPSVYEPSPFRSILEIGQVPPEGGDYVQPECWPSYGVGISDQVDESTGIIPKYHSLLGRKVSGRMEDNQVYTLKILDSSSQINLNSMINPYDPQNSSYAVTPMGRILNILSQAIRDDSKSGYTGHEKGPLKGLGELIIQYRNSIGGFLNKYEVIGTYSGTTITREDFNYIADYLTIHPTIEEMKKMAVSRNLRAYNNSDETYQNDYRFPINVNSATAHVIYSLFCNIGTSSVSISATEAKMLTANLMYIRNLSPILSLDKLYEFFDWQDKQKTVDPDDNPVTDNIKINGAFYVASPTSEIRKKNLLKIATLKANFDPNVTLRRTNPDSPVYQVINKTELIHSSLEFCFFPNGRFDITSLGQVLDESGSPKMAKQLFTTVRVYDLVSYHTQYDFEGCNGSLFYKEGVIPSLPSKITLEKKETGGKTVVTKGYNAFTYSNNLQKTYGDIELLRGEASPVMGHIMPLAYDLSLGDSAITSYRFRADYNGTLDGQDKSASAIVAGGTKATMFQNIKTIIPRAGTSTLFSDLAPDGVVISKTSNTTLYYPSRNGTLPESSGMFPKIADGSCSSWDENKGTLCFWFKIGRDWLDKDYEDPKDSRRETEFRTIFLATTYYETTVDGANYKCGLQRAVQLWVRGVGSADGDGVSTEHPNMPLLRKVTVRIQHKFFSYLVDSDGSVKEKNPLKIPSDYIESSVEYQCIPYVDGTKSAYGMHAQEWYHMAIRWYNGADITFNPNYSFKVTGIFYNYRDASKAYESDTVNSRFIFETAEEDKKEINKNLIDKMMVSSGYEVRGDGLEKDDENNLVPIADGKFKALYPELAFENRVYIGYAPIVDSTSNVLPAEHCITIDDVRMADETTIISDATKYNPGRFPKADNVSTTATTDYCYGLFQGKFQGAAQGKITFIYWTVRPWGDKIIITPQASTEQLIGEASITAWTELWNHMTDGAPTSSVAFSDRILIESDGSSLSATAGSTLPPIQAHISVYTYYQHHSWKWKKWVEFIVPKNKYQWKKLWEDRGRDPDLFPPYEKTDNKTYAFPYIFGYKEGTLREILTAWFNFMKGQGYYSDIASINELAPPEEYGYVPGQASEPEVLDTNNEYTYAVRFPVYDQKNPYKPLIKSPCVDDITMIYIINKAIFLEYMDIY